MPGAGSTWQYNTWNRDNAGLSGLPYTTAAPPSHLLFLPLPAAVVFQRDDDRVLAGQEGVVTNGQNGFTEGQGGGEGTAVRNARVAAVFAVVAVQLNDAGPKL